MKINFKVRSLLQSAYVCICSFMANYVFTRLWRIGDWRVEEAIKNSFTICIKISFHEQYTLLTRAMERNCSHKYFINDNNECMHSWTFILRIADWFIEVQFFYYYFFLLFTQPISIVNWMISFRKAWALHVKVINLCNKV